MAASIVAAIPGLGDAAGSIIKGAGLFIKCEQMLKVGKAVSTTCRMIGAVAQTGVNAINFDKAFRSVRKEYRETGHVSFWNGANAVLSGLGVVGGVAQSVRSVKSFNKMRSSLSSKVEEKSRGILSDYLGVSEKSSNGKFYSIENAAGGEVFVSTSEIYQCDFANIVRNKKGNINIISGVHGNISGYTKAEFDFFAEDFNTFSNMTNVNVYNFNEMNYNDFASIINSDSTSILAWCFSERTPAVRMGLKTR